MHQVKLVLWNFVDLFRLVLNLTVKGVILIGLNRLEFVVLKLREPVSYRKFVKIPLWLIRLWLFKAVKS